VLSGIAATKVIREVLNLRNMPIVALTAGALAGEHESCLKAGMDDFIAKPFDVENLIATILKYARPSNTPAATGAEKSSDVLRNEVPEATGLDIAQAYGRLGGDRRLLVNLLQMLLDQFGDVGKEIRTELNAKNYEKLLRRLHTLKGTAGNIGAVDVAQLATFLEAKIRSGSLEDADDFLLQLELAFDELKQTLAAMQAFDRQLNLKADHVTFEELLLSLEERKLQAVGQFRSLSGMIAVLYGQESCHDLARAIESLDFAEAVIKLKGMRMQRSSDSVRPVN